MIYLLYFLDFYQDEKKYCDYTVCCRDHFVNLCNNQKKGKLVCVQMVAEISGAVSATDR